jgi:hypothetical protein
MTIELDEKGDQVFVDGHRYSRIMPGTLDSQVWIWTNTGNTSRQTTPGVIEIDDDDDDEDDIELIEDDDEVEYEGEIPRLSTRQPSLYPRMFSTPYCTPAPPTHRHSNTRDFGKRRQTGQERQMSIVSTTGGDWPLASLYRIPSDRVKQVVREATSHGLYARVIPRSRVVPVPMENNLPWVKEEYEEEDSGFFENFGEGSSGRMLNGNVGGGRRGKERERDWEVILGTDEGAVEHLQRIVLNDQEEERQRESLRAISHHRHHHHHPPPAMASNPPPLPIMPVPMTLGQSPQSGTSWLSILMAMVMGAIAMFYVLLKMPDD